VTAIAGTYPQFSDAEGLASFFWTGGISMLADSSSVGLYLGFSQDQYQGPAAARA
jgi:hypothetical protein